MDQEIEANIIQGLKIEKDLIKVKRNSEYTSTGQ